MTEILSSIDLSMENLDRPYSQIELRERREKNLREQKFNVNVYAIHENCSHFYRVKKYSKKEKQILETGDKDVGNCSVCWNIKNNKNRFDKNLIEEYLNLFEKEALYGECIYVDNYMLELEDNFLHWLNNPN